MTYKQWTVDDLPWDRFDASKVDSEILKVAKAAALVEANARVYAEYLENVFKGDAELIAACYAWAGEEQVHGYALGAWAERADPSWNFKEAFARFTAGYQFDKDTAVSRRGSRSGELVSRCIVEVGTSSYYTALAEATDEPVFQEIARRIAADELRHYKLFYDNLKRYLDSERLNRVQRLWIAIGRINETEDDELSFAYHAANHWTEPYDRVASFRAYTTRAYSYYRPHHLDRMVAMVFKASGLKPQGWLHDVAAKFAYRRMKKRAEGLAAAA